LLIGGSVSSSNKSNGIKSSAARGEMIELVVV
jgi:hypothetical protein